MNYMTTAFLMTASDSGRRILQGAFALAIFALAKAFFMAGIFRFAAKYIEYM